MTNDGEMKIETITNVPRKLHTESNTHSGLTWVFDLPCAFPYTDAAGYTWNTCLHDSSENYGMCTMAIKKMGYCRECQDQTCSSFLSGCYSAIYGAEDQNVKTNVMINRGWRSIFDKLGLHQAHLLVS